MSGLTVLILYVVGATTLAYRRATLKVAAASSIVFLFVYFVFASGSLFWTLVLLTTSVVLALLSIDNLRRDYVSKPLFKFYKSALPPISETEREAIDAGTVWWEGEIFTGNPDWQKLLGSGKPVLTEDEQSFLDGPVEELCKMVDPWESHYSSADIPEQVVQHIKDERFLGMIIPKEYGGLDLSAIAQAKVLTKISTWLGCRDLHWRAEFSRPR